MEQCCVCDRKFSVDGEHAYFICSVCKVSLFCCMCCNRTAAKFTFLTKTKEHTHEMHTSVELV